MDQKALVKLSMEKSERTYEFYMPIGSPYGEAYDAAFEMLQEITKMSQEAADKAKREDITIKTDDDKEDN